VLVLLKINAGKSIVLLVGPQFDFLTGALLKDDATDEKTKNIKKILKHSISP